MKRSTLAAFVVALLLTYSRAFAQTPLNGTWYVTPVRDRSQVQLELRIPDGQGHFRNEISHTIALSDLGLTESQLEAGGRLSFVLRRDAGTLSCEGSAQSGSAFGHFTFTENPGYGAYLRSHGYGVEEPRKFLTAALIDLSPRYVDSIDSAGFTNLTFDNLVAFRALRIDLGYIQEMRAHFNDIDAENIVPLKALDVTDAYLTDLKSVGIQPATAQDAVEMRALHVDASYAREMASVGYAHVSSHDLVQMRALGIDAAFVRRVEGHGFHNLSVQKLIEAKAMNVI